MFDFLDFMDSDWFVISLEVAFLLFMAFDIKKYFQTHDKKQKQSYLLNIVLTLGFFIWTAIPFYNKYFQWSDEQKAQTINSCIKEYNLSHCECLTDAIFKEYSFDHYKELDDINATSLQEFITDSSKECLED